SSNGIFLERSKSTISEKGLKGSSAKLFPPYSIMMTSRATIGAVGINSSAGCTNQGFITCLPNDRIPYTFLYHWIVSNKETFELLASGSTFLEITKGTFKKINILLPKKDILNRFHIIVNPIFKQIENLLQKNTQLNEIRDRLLPRLISGKLKLKIAEEVQCL
ncbi:restriction endonuclease subunit S, partial [Mucilaginibacter sp. Mucisp84]